MSIDELTRDEQDFEAAFAASAKAAPNAQDDSPADEGAEPERLAPQAEAREREEDRPPPEPAQRNGKAEELTALQQDLSQALHRERSSSNRLSHFMRENNQLKEQVQSLQRQMDEMRAAPAARASASMEPGEDPLNDVLEEAPDLKAAVERRIQREVKSLRDGLAAANSKLAEVDQTANRAAQDIEPLASREEQRQIESVYGQLDKSFDHWRGDLRTPAFGQWLNTQTPAIQSMFQGGRTYAEAATVLRLFYAEQGASTSPPPARGASANQERLQRAAGIAPRALTKLSSKADDFEGAFAEFASQTRR